MIVRVSERGTFRRCRRRWDYSSPNRQNLTTASSPVYLTFGSLIHATLETWAEDLGSDPHQIFLKQAAESVQEMRKRYKKVVGVWPSEEEVGVLYDAIDMGQSMISAYAQRWGSPIPEGYKKVQLEQTFLVEVPSTGDLLQGTLDGLLQNEDTGEYTILERKTYGARPRQDLLDRNDQFLSYIWGLQQVTKGPISGIFYDGLWKRKFEAKRKLEDMTLRLLLNRTQAEVDEFGKLLTLEVQDMANDPAIYPNHRWEGCYDCPFVKLCDAESQNKNFEYVKNTFFRFNEIEGEEESDYTSAAE